MGQKQVFKPYAIIESTMIWYCRKMSSLFGKKMNNTKYKRLDTTSLLGKNVNT